MDPNRKHDLNRRGAFHPEHDWTDRWHPEHFREWLKALRRSSDHIDDENARIVYNELIDLALEGRYTKGKPSIQVTASHGYLAGRTGLGEFVVRMAIRELQGLQLLWRLTSTWQIKDPDHRASLEWRMENKKGWISTYQFLTPQWQAGTNAGPHPSPVVSPANWRNRDRILHRIDPETAEILV